MTTIGAMQPHTPRAAASARRIAVDAGANVALLGLLWAGYALVRGLVGDTRAVALDNAAQLLAFEQTLGLDIEAGVQSLVTWPAAHVAANSYYLLHFPLTLVVLGVAFVRCRSRAFPVMRNALIGCTAAALVIHLIAPMAPPRMLPGFIDSGVVFGPDPYAVAGSETANQFAAMPSMHVAWAIVAGVAVWGLARHRVVRVLAAAHPLVTAAVVVVTGHHFVSDVAIGALAAVAALAAASRLLAGRPATL